MDSKTQPSQEDSQAGQEVVLLLTADGSDYFHNVNRVLAAQAAGFEFSRTRATTLALLSQDTKEDIAVMEVNGFKEAMAELSTIVIRMNPHTCPEEWQAGTRFTASVEKFARLMSAKICNEDGVNLSEEDFKAIGDKVDAIHQARREAEYKARPRATMPDGTIRVGLEGLSFIAEYRTKRGRHLRTEHFDVPELTYGEGQVKGFQIAAEYLKFMETHHQHRYWYGDVIADAVRAVGKHSYSDTVPTRGSVARAFLDVVVGQLLFSARNSNYGPWIAQKIEGKRAQMAQWAEFEANEKREFVERMKVARQRKAEAKATPTAERSPSTTKTARPAARKVEAVAA